MKIQIDFLVAETFERLLGTISFMEVVDKAVPEVESHEHQILKNEAEKQNWDFSDYAAEQQLLNEKFRWVRTLTTYSLVILLYSAVEAQLNALAERIRTEHGSSFELKDIRGSGIDRAALYLKTVGTLDVKNDPAWPHLRNLQTLRNVIAHSGGKWLKSIAEWQQLLIAYSPDLSFQGSNDVRGEINISVKLCRSFAEHAQGFFERTFKAAGLQDKGVQMVP
jgi:hypothetical protein